MWYMIIRDHRVMGSQIKGPDNPTCQEREKRWWKTGWVREFGVRRLRATRFVLCIWKSMCEFCGDGGRQIVWKRYVWESCVWETCLWEGCVCVCVCEEVVRGKVYDDQMVMRQNRVPAKQHLRARKCKWCLTSCLLHYKVCAPNCATRRANLFSVDMLKTILKQVSTQKEIKSAAHHA